MARIAAVAGFARALPVALLRKLERPYRHSEEGMDA